jgi:cytidylate kinase
MPEIAMGPRPLDQIQDSNHIVLVFHTIPDEEGGLGGCGLSTMVDVFAKVLGINGNDIIKTGDFLRDIYRDTLKPDDPLLSDSAFNQWRKDRTPENLKDIDLELDKKTAQKAIKMAETQGITIVDSKIFAWLQEAGENAPEDYSFITQATLFVIGVTAEEEVSINRTINREQEKNGKSLTYEEARQQRLERTKTDFSSYQTLYPKHAAKKPYNRDVLTTLSHAIINTSEDATPEEREQFAVEAIQKIAEDFPQLAPTLIDAIQRTTKLCV